MDKLLISSYYHFMDLIHNPYWLFLASDNEAIDQIHYLLDVNQLDKTTYRDMKILKCNISRYLVHLPDLKYEILNQIDYFNTIEDIRYVLDEWFYGDKYISEIERSYLNELYFTLDFIWRLNKLEDKDND